MGRGGSGIYALGTEVTIVSVEANEASAVVADAGPPLLFTYTIPTLALAETGVEVEFGKGGEAQPYWRMLVLLYPSLTPSWPWC